MNKIKYIFFLVIYTIIVNLIFIEEEKGEKLGKVGDIKIVQWVGTSTLLKRGGGIEIFEKKGWGLPNFRKGVGAMTTLERGGVKTKNRMILLIEVYSMINNVTSSRFFCTISDDFFYQFVKVIFRSRNRFFWYY